RIAAGGGIYRPEDRIDGPVAGERACDLLAAGGTHTHGRVRGTPGRRFNVEPLELVTRHLLAQLVGDQRFEVHRGDVLLLVGDLLEAPERGVQRLSGELDAQL